MPNNSLIIADRLALLPTITLDSGSHPSFEAGHCVNEVAAWLAGEPHSDSPSCVSPFLRDFTMRLNDRWDDENRQTLTPYAAKIVGTAGDGQDDARVLIARGEISKLVAPWYRLAGLVEHADKIDTIDWTDVSGARRVLWAARDAAWALRAKQREQRELIVRETLAKKGIAAVAVAVAVADAVAAAGAVAAAAAVAGADAVADAAAAAAAGAVAVAAAVAVADADAVAAADAAADAAAAAAAAADAAAGAVADAVAAAGAVAAAAAVAVADAAADAAGQPVDLWGKPYDDAREAATKIYTDWINTSTDAQAVAIRELRDQQQGAALALLDRLIDPSAEGVAA